MSWKLAGKVGAIAALFAVAASIVPILARAGDSPPGAKIASKPDYDRDVRPLLARCIQCHGPSQAKSGLRLDNRANAVRKLDSGASAIVPNDPEASELLRRVISAEKSERMPPTGERLTVAQIEILRRWISAGAEWAEHWAYRPLVKPDVPSSWGKFPNLPVSDSKREQVGKPASRSGAITPIDRFILKGLVDRNLSPAPPADKRTLLRRLTFDLVGLPPTPREMEVFLADESPDAYERVVDRLLASPHYGERWSRHWMDTVHFAETHGHDQDRPRENAWPYRDYLIRSFNDDKPYAKFVEEQIAGDVLYPDEPWAIVATGFLATGSWDESSLRDIRDDTLDREIARYLDRDDIVTTVMSTFASTTVHCARCHDHKFDPVTTEEYYGLQAVFAGIDKANRPYDSDPALAATRRQLAVRRAELARLKAAADPALLAADVQSQVAAWQADVAQSGRLWQVLESRELKSASGATLQTQTDGTVLSTGTRPEKDTYTFIAETDLDGLTALRLELLTDESLPKQGPGRQDNGNLHLNEIRVTAAPKNAPDKVVAIPIKAAEADFNQEGWTIDHALDGKPSTAWGIYPQVGKPHRGIFRFREPITNSGGTVLTVELEQSHGGGHLIGKFRLSATTATEPRDAEALPANIVVLLKIAPSDRTPPQRAELAAFVLQKQLAQQIAALPPQQLVYCGTNTFAKDGSFAPSNGPRPISVLERGDVRNPRAAAQPGALSCVPGLDARWQLADGQHEGSRRAALAHWLTDSRNGLAWRSIVNRVWQYHFGRGLIDTPNDFGRMGSSPTHPQLLDWLAVTLQESGGSLKQLHRLVVTSAAYRQSSQHNEQFAEIDADNHYLWRMNRQRLDGEAIHDALLVFSGQLDPRMGGPSVRQFIQTPGIHVTPNVDYVNFDVNDPALRRRSVYRFVFRTLPDPLMDSLDCPDGSQLTPTRNASITPLQALSLLNDKFVVRQSELIAERIAATSPELKKQIVEAYRVILARTPSPQELQVVCGYATKHGLANACRVLLNSNEFVFVE